MTLNELIAMLIDIRNNKSSGDTVITVFNSDLKVYEVVTDIIPDSDYNLEIQTEQIKLDDKKKNKQEQE